jgi:hypothetical protein
MDARRQTALLTLAALALLSASAWGAFAVDPEAAMEPNGRQMPAAVYELERLVDRGAVALAQGRPRQDLKGTLLPYAVPVGSRDEKASPPTAAPSPQAADSKTVGWKTSHVIMFLVTLCVAGFALWRTRGRCRCQV